MRSDILERLRIDPGQRTLGQLLQDREAAIHEIARLRAATHHLSVERTTPRSQHVSGPRPGGPKDELSKSPFRAGTLIRLTEVCELLGLSRSKVYKLLSEGKFPRPVRVSARSVRWDVDALEAWREGLRS